MAPAPPRLPLPQSLCDSVLGTFCVWPGLGFRIQSLPPQGPLLWGSHRNPVSAVVTARVVGKGSHSRAGLGGAGRGLCTLRVGAVERYGARICFSDGLGCWPPAGRESRWLPASGVTDWLRTELDASSAVEHRRGAPTSRWAKLAGPQQGDALGIQGDALGRGPRGVVL